MFQDRPVPAHVIEKYHRGKKARPWQTLKVLPNNMHSACQTTIQFSIAMEGERQERRPVRRQGGHAQVANFDLPAVTIDVDLVAAEVSMDDGRLLLVQVVQPCQDLPRPFAHSLQLHLRQESCSSLHLASFIVKAR